MVTIKEKVSLILSQTAEKNVKKLVELYFEEWKHDKRDSVRREIYRQLKPKKLMFNYSEIPITKQIRLKDIILYLIKYNKEMTFKYVYMHSGLFKSEYDKFVENNKEVLEHYNLLKEEKI